MAQVSNELQSVAHRVPIWGWGVLGGGVFLLVMSRHSKSAAAIVDSNAVIPAASNDTGGGGDTGGDTGGGGGGGGFGAYVPPTTTPGTTPDPTPNPTPYYQKITDIWGGDLGHLLGGMTNQANFVDYTAASGDHLSFGNAAGTYGGGNGTALVSPDDAANARAAAAAEAAGLRGFNLDVLKQNQNTFLANIAAAYGRAFRSDGPGQYDAAAAPTYAAPVDPASTGIIGNTASLIAAGLPASTAYSAPVTPAASVAAGNYAGIKGMCAPHDVDCAHRVAPWWRGDPIGGWS